MGITFDHVEGVVQKASEPSPTPQPEIVNRTPKPAAESYEETHRRMERIARRLHAD